MSKKVLILGGEGNGVLTAEAMADANRGEDHQWQFGGFINNRSPLGELPAAEEPVGHLLNPLPTDLKDKKLLLLGGHPLMIHVVEKARELGVKTIVTDYIPGAPAKAVADQSYNVSTLDVEALIALAKKEKVDGVFTGYVDINLIPCARVCQALNLPFYATEAQLIPTLNKVLFKEMCRKYGLKVAEDISAELISNNPQAIHFPVIVKPADSYSSKGISVSHDPASLNPAIEKALGFSTVGEVVVEEFIEGDDVYLYLTIQHGKVSLSAMADRLMNNEQYGKAPQPVGYYFPSRYIDRYYEQIHHRLQQMMSNLGMENGTFFLQGFVRDKQIILFEMGPRLSGGAGYLPIQHHSRIDLLAMHIRYALTGLFGGWDIQKVDNPRFNQPYFVLVVLLRNGTISKINGLEEIRNHERVYHILQFRYSGEIMEEEGTLNQVFARIYCYANNRQELKMVIKNIMSLLRIEDEKGDSMILNWFSPDEIIND